MLKITQIPVKIGDTLTKAHIAKKLHAKVEAETKKITAQGEADANAILNGSLTDQVISQAYIEALKEIGKQGNLIVVPEGTSPILNTTKDK